MDVVKRAVSFPFVTVVAGGEGWIWDSGVKGPPFLLSGTPYPYPSHISCVTLDK